MTPEEATKRRYEAEAEIDKWSQIMGKDASDPAWEMIDDSAGALCDLLGEVIAAWEQDREELKRMWEAHR